MNQAVCARNGAGEMTWDALVVGAGPAGSLAARVLARAGARVLLVDRKAFPRGKVCGACLNGPALSLLDAHGLRSLVARLGGIDLEEFRLGLAGRSIRLPLPAGVALSRVRLDAALVEAAREAGAAFLPETRAVVEALDGDRRRVSLVRPHGLEPLTATARVVLVASGLGPPDMKGDPAAQSVVSARSRVGAGCAVADFPEHYREGAIFMAVGRHGYVGLVRVEDGRLNVASAFDHGFLRACGRPARAAAEVLAEAGFPAIDALDAADWQGTVRLTRRTRPVALERVFLIGDAAGYVEPFTGEGIGWALGSAHDVAPLALRAIGRWESSLIGTWVALHRKRVGHRQYLCRGLALLSRHPRPARLALGLATRAPSMARFMVRQVNKPLELYGNI